KDRGDDSKFSKLAGDTEWLKKIRICAQELEILCCFILCEDLSDHLESID
ncbi:hypothetical protein ACJX0J_019606, partial [Zea mays]